MYIPHVYCNKRTDGCLVEPKHTLRNDKSIFCTSSPQRILRLKLLFLLMFTKSSTDYLCCETSTGEYSFLLLIHDRYSSQNQ